jgi:hypothetical protein
MPLLDDGGVDVRKPSLTRFAVFVQADLSGAVAAEEAGEAGHLGFAVSLRWAKAVQRRGDGWPENVLARRRRGDNGNASVLHIAATPIGKHTVEECHRGILARRLKGPPG